MKYAQDSLNADPFFSVFNLLSEGVIFQNAEGLITRVNQSAERLLNIEARDLIGKGLFQVLKGDLTQNKHRLIRDIDPFQAALLNGASIQRVKFPFLAPDYGCKWLSFNIQPFFSNIEAKPSGIVSSFRDITDVINTKEQLDVLSLVAERTINAVIITDQDNKIIWVNEGFSTVTGYSATEAIGRTPGAILQGKRTDAESVKYMREKRKNGEDFECEILNYKKDGTPFWMRMQTQPVRDDFGKIIKYFGLGTDITEQRKLTSDLLKQKVLKQREISRAILKTQESERNQIGRELHDNVNQLLASVNLYLGNMRKERVFDREVVDNCIQYIEDAIAEIRNLTSRFVSPVGRTVPLKDSLKELCTTLSFTSRLDIILDMDQFDEQRIGQECKQNIFRIVQEQLTNTIKHAGAGSVKISLVTNATGLELIISDDGKGFDMKTCKKGLGLINIKHRAESFNGKANIISAEGKGCMVHVVLPLDTCSA